MIKMNMKKFVLAAIMLMLVAVPAVLAADNLHLEKITAKIDGKKSSVDPGETFSREAQPGSKVEFEMEFFNNYTSEEDLDIEDVTVTVTIEGIDDDDDLEEETKDFSIRANDDKKVDVTFEIPVEVETGTYTITFDAEGEDENGTDQSKIWEAEIEIEKEKHELRFYKTSLSPSEVKCNSVTYLNLGLINTGEEDEEEVVLSVTSDALEFSESVTIEELVEGAYDDDVKTSKKYRIPVPEMEPGVYQIDAKAVYDEGDEEVTQSFDLTVTECVVEEEVPEEPEEEEKEDEVVVVKQKPEITTPVVTEPVVTAPAAPAETEEKSFLESGWFIGLLIFLEVAIIAGAVLLVMALVKKKKTSEDEEE